MEITLIKATYVDHMGSDLSVVNSARVSFGKKSKLICTDLIQGTYDLSKGDKGLIKYLAKHEHTSPFGHAFASFHVKAPIFVARQLVKHKFLRWNEVSRRYVSDNIEFYQPDLWRGQAKDKKQGSSGEVHEVDSIFYGMQMPKDFVERHDKSCLHVYNVLLDSGVCEEQARMSLPQNTMTEWYWSGSLDAFAAMCKLRCASDTQYETRIVADQISEAMLGLFPVSWEALS